jgi:ribonuclease P protein component
MINIVERQTFGKSERLCKTRLIDELFENGKIFYTPLFKVVWATSTTQLPSPAQIAVTVPKKTIKLAVRRNLIKRRTREAYRKMKEVLYSSLASQKIQIIFILIYRLHEPAEYKQIEKSVAQVIEKLRLNIRDTA